MNWRSPQKQELVQAFLGLENAEEIQRFLRDLLTESEIEEFSKRFKAAEMLSTNTSYSKISKETGLSSTTIARVSKYLNGKEGGYRRALNILHHHTPSQSGRELS